MRDLAFNGDLIRLTQARLKFTNYRPNWKGTLTASEVDYDTAGTGGNGAFIMVKNEWGSLARRVGTSWVTYASHPVKSGVPVWGMYDGYVFYTNPDGYWTRARWDGSTFEAPVVSSYTGAGIPVSMTETYSTSGGIVTYANTETLQTQSAMDRVYNSWQSDAVKVNGVGYIYIYDWIGKRTYYVKHENGRFSEPRLLIPMDVVDDLTSFELGGASEINGQVYITGLLKRKNLDKKLHVMFIGPEKVAMGREMVIGATPTTTTYPYISRNWPGKVYLNYTALYYRSRQYYSTGAYANMFGVSIPTRERIVGPLSVRVAMTANQAAVLQAEIRTSDTVTTNWNYPNPIVPGALCELEVNIGGVFQKVGTFNVDVVARPRDAAGQKVSIVARSHGIKKLDQWESDTPYDFWSQTKLSANAADLTKVIRVSGNWKEQDNALYLDRMNKPGFLYLAAKSCTSGIVRASITPFAGTSFRFGLGMYYHFEGKYDAAARLEKSLSDLKEGEAFSNGLFVMYDNGVFTIQQVVNDVFTTLADNGTPISANVSLAAGSKYWVQALFRAGRVTVRYRLDTATSWTTVMDVVPTYSTYPWRADGVGRAAIFCENYSQWSYTPGFTSDGGIIAADPSVFPVSETLEVNSELIKHGGVLGGVEYGGATFKLTGDLSSENKSGGTYFDMGKYPEWQTGSRTFGVSGYFVVETLSFSVKKVGSPAGSIRIGVKNGSGVSVQSVDILPDEFSEKSRWVTVRFPTPVVLLNSSTLYISNLGSASTTNHYKVDLHEANLLAYKTTYTKLASSSDAILSNPHIRLRSSHALNGTFSKVKIRDTVYDITTQAASIRTVTGTYETLMRLSADFSQWYDLAYPYTTAGFVGRTTLTPTVRGAYGTTATAQTAGIVSVYSPRPALLIHKVEFYSTDIDMTLADVATEIAGKAGVKVVTDEMRAAPLPHATGFYVQRGELIGVYDIGNHSTGTIRFSPWLTAQTLTDQYTPYFDVYADRIEYLKRHNVTPYYILRESFPLSEPLNGKVRVSFYDNTVSFWNCDRLIHSFQLTDDDRRTTVFDNYLYISNTTGQDISFHIPYACQRIDNFIMDNGKKGTALLNDLAGRRKIFFTETIDGSIRLFRSRTEVNLAAPYRLAVSTGKVETDIPIATRIRIEGGEVYETISSAIWKHGNVFTMAHIPEINNWEDVGYFTGIMLEDAANEYSRRELTGAADWRIEPQDIIYVELPDRGDPNFPTGLPEGVTPLIVDSINFDMVVNQDAVQCDMTLIGIGGIL